MSNLLYEPLTVEQLEAMEPGVFAQGTVADNPTGVNMTNSDKLLRWVAVRGNAPDWKIYIHWATSDYEFVRTNGDKVTNAENIKKLVPCTDEAFAEYRY